MNGRGAREAGTWTAGGHARGTAVIERSPTGQAAAARRSGASSNGAEPGPKQIGVEVRGIGFAAALVLLALRGPGATPREFSEQLVAAIDRILDDYVEHAAAFRPGHAFCHRCSSSVCEHSAPPSAR